MDQEARAAKKRKRDAFEESQFEGIAPNGDVTFVLDDGAIRVRVHSALMKNASPVFRAMLTPGFKEGNALAEAKGEKIEIRLPGDSGEVFGWMCVALHSQADTTLWVPDVDQILDLAALAEKYDLVAAIQLSFTFWVDKRLPDASVENLWSLLAVSYQFDTAETFQSISRQLILQHENSFIELAHTMQARAKSPEIRSMVYLLAGALKEARSNILETINGLLSDLVMGNLERGCTGSDGRVLRYLHDLIYGVDEWSKLPGHLVLPLCNIFKDLRSIQFDIPTETSCATCQGRAHDHPSKLRGELDQIYDGLKGICLVCFRQCGSSSCKNTHA